jgi:3',5'-cyclic AMP phosphodiesterase CpdA
MSFFKRVMKGAWLFCIVLVLTAVPARATEPFFFIQLTDPQFGMFADNTNFAQETANFEFAVATVNRLHPAFVVITGDLVNKTGDAAQIKEYKRILAQVDPAIPVYNVAGNHDVGNVPTPKMVAAYTNQFGPDHYSFHHQGFVGIVLDSNLIQAPTNVMNLAGEQEQWLATELAAAQKAGAQHIVVFQHHPWFLKSVGETNQYFNLPREARAKYLPLFHQFGVKEVFCGHYHRNVVSRDGDLEIVTTGATGKPLGGDKSGLQIVIVRDEGIQHHYYSFGDIPNRIDVSSVASTK